MVIQNRWLYRSEHKKNNNKKTWAKSCEHIQIRIRLFIEVPFYRE